MLLGAMCQKDAVKTQTWLITIAQENIFYILNFVNIAILAIGTVRKETKSAMGFVSKAVTAKAIDLVRTLLFFEAIGQKEC